MRRLLLFDIDATLLATGGLGVRAMEEAGKELFHAEFTVDGLDFAGRLDPLLVRDLLAMNRVERTPAVERAFRAMYARRLAKLIAASGGHAALPGVLALLDRLEGHGSSPVLGLLTGNYAETGCMKLRACGIDPLRFAIAAWGDDSPHDPPERDHLPPIAMKRYRERFGHACEPARVTVIGDTPHDVRCARANGCRVLGVGTGRYTTADLQRAGADQVVGDLAATEQVAAWLLEG